MKKLVSILLVCCALNVVAMDRPATVLDSENNAAEPMPSPMQIEEAARKEIIIKGPQAQTHKLGSLMWAYMHPKETEYNENGIKFPHYKYSFVKYIMKWEDVHKELQELKKGTSKEILKAIADNYFTHGPEYCFAFSEKFNLVKTHLTHFEKDTEGNITPQMIASRAQYRIALRNSDWQQLPQFAQQKLHPRDFSYSQLFNGLKSLMLIRLIQNAQQVQAAHSFNVVVMPEEPQEKQGSWCLLM